MNINPALAADFYKTSHVFQYPEGTQSVYSNFTPRSGVHANMPASFDNKVVFFGLQGFAKWYLIDTWNREFFGKPKEEVVRKYKRRVDNALGPGAVTVDHIANLHDLGFLPLQIKALPEGSRVDLRVPFFTVQETYDEFFWLTNYIETVASCELWKPCTVGTIAYEYRRILDKYVELTGSSKEFADWQLHDFSMRGMSGVHDAATCGAAHLVAAGFGTDTIPAIDYLEDYYSANSDVEMVGGSVAATEHSVMCMGGKETEIETFRRLINDVYPSGIVSIVSDTWDFWHVITKLAAELKEEILARKPNALGMAKVVFRPDSGDPVRITTGRTYLEVESLDEDGYDCVDDCSATPEIVKYQGKYYDYKLEEDYLDMGYGEGYYTNSHIELLNEVPEHEVKGAVECLWDTFGGDVTEKGYKTLNQRVGLIYGDSITLARAEAILERLAAKGFSAGNIVFGIGSYTYQYITRDTFGMAMKATWGVVNEEARELFKDPATDSGTKKSAKGLLRVEREDGKFVLYDQQDCLQAHQGELQTVFKNGVLVREQSLTEIRKLLKEPDGTTS